MGFEIVLLLQSGAHNASASINPTAVALAGLLLQVTTEYEYCHGI